MVYKVSWIRWRGLMVLIFIFIFAAIWSFVDAAEKVSWINDPQCGVSETFPNHRQPRKDSLSEITQPRMIDYESLATEVRETRGRIIDGQEATKNSWPWQVSIQLNVSELGFVGHWCGGVLIHPTWVLTAAHCIKNHLLNDFDDVIWMIRFNSASRGFAVSQENFVDDVILHPGFENYQDDIALLHLSTSARGVSPVCLPSAASLPRENFLGLRCYATGWGQTRLGGSMQNFLHQVELTVVENRHCSLVYGVMYNIDVGDNHLCAGPILRGGKGTCIGDSGGPLHCNMADGRWYLAGLTSFGSGCARPGFPDVFTRLTSYERWISESIGNYK